MFINKGTKSKKVISLLFVSIFIFSIGLISSITYKQGSSLDLKIPTNLSDCNITIAKPNSNTLIDNKVMSTNSGYANYTIDSSSLMTNGEYEYFSNCGSGTFTITPSGFSGGDNLGYVIVMLFGLFAINLIGFFKKNATITMLGGIGLTFLGLYFIQNGIVIFRDNLTLAISYITLFWGAGSSLWAGVETIQDNL